MTPTYVASKACIYFVLSPRSVMWTQITSVPYDKSSGRKKISMSKSVNVT